MKRKLVLLSVVVIGLAAVAWFGSGNLSIESLAAREIALRDNIEAHPVSSWFAALGIYFLASLVPGTRGKAIVCGWLFGFWAGVVLVNFALTAAAVVAFLVSRYLVGEIVQSRFARQVSWANTALEREGAWYVILLRVVPVSFSLTNYLLGATTVKVRTYWWATQVGVLPGNLAFVFLGAGLPSLREIAEQGVLSLFSWELMVGFVLLSLLPLAVHRLVQFLRGHSIVVRVPQSPSM